LGEPAGCSTSNVVLLLDTYWRRWRPDREFRSRVRPGPVVGVLRPIMLIGTAPNWSSGRCPESLQSGLKNPLGRPAAQVPPPGASTRPSGRAPEPRTPASGARHFRVTLPRADRDRSALGTWPSRKSGAGQRFLSGAPIFPRHIIDRITCAFPLLLSSSLFLRRILIYISRGIRRSL
jgi:hypothetical protein